MSNIEYINFELLNYIKSSNIKSLNELTSIFSENKIKIKYDINSNLAILSNGFRQNLNELQSECRSLIIDKETLEVICYTYDNILYNNDAKNEFLKSNPKDFVIQESFEGTLLSVFYYNDKWHISTRKCINAKESKWNNKKSHYDMFLECLDFSFEKFTSYLKPDYNYFFVLVHHDNKHIVDYSKYFQDDKYKKIIHIMTRDRKTHKDININDSNQWKTNPNFRIPLVSNDDDLNVNKLKKFINNEMEVNIPYNYDDFGNLDLTNTKNHFDLPIETEGLIVKIYDEKTNKVKILKFQTNCYQFMSILNPNTQNIYMGFVQLYKEDKLKLHLEYFPGNVKLNDIYDTIGVIDASFKVFTSELFELFRYLYDLKNCSHKNSDFYKILSHEYTVVLYKIRGIYYKKKEKYIKNKIDSVSMDNTYNYSLKIFDIYNLLKKEYDTIEMLNLFRARKEFIKKYRDSKYKNIISKISSRCEKIHLSMIDILCDKIYPDE